jgi:hypothetical protein
VTKCFLSISSSSRFVLRAGYIVIIEMKEVPLFVKIWGTAMGLWGHGGNWGRAKNLPKN